MHDVESVEHFEGLQKLPKNEQSFGLREMALLFKSVIESASITKFIHKIVVVSCLKMLFVLDDVFRGSDR